MADKNLLKSRLQRPAPANEDKFARADEALSSPTMQAPVAPNAALVPAIESTGTPRDSLPERSPKPAPVAPIPAYATPEVEPTTRLSFTMTGSEKETIDRIRLELFEASGRKSFPSEGEIIRIALQLLEGATSAKVAQVHARMPKLVRGKGLRH